MPQSTWTVRAIADHERVQFVSVGSSPEAAQRMQNFLDEIFELGESQPTWCFWASDGSNPVARVIYVRLSVADGAFVLKGLALPWNADPVPFGQTLIEDSRAQMGATVQSLNMAIWDDEPHAGVKSALMQALGWPLAQHRHRYERQAHAGPLEAPSMLRFLSAEQVGKEAFVAAIARVTESTLDQALREDVERLGLLEAAERHWVDLTQFDNRTDRYELAYDAGDALVGLIVPQCFGEMGVINYIGVVPEQRGHGYARQLLQRGCEMLESTEMTLTRIVADIDVRNAPMANALKETGFALRRTERRYRAP